MRGRNFEIEENLLIAAARKGDEAAFGKLVDRYKDVVFATIVAVTRDLDYAQDIAQEVFLRAWFGLGRLQDGTALPGWLKAIARNRALSWRTRHMRQPQGEKIDLTQIADSADSPESQMEKAEQRRLVLSALDKLSERGREVMILHYLEELPTPEIARRLDISQAAVRQRMRHARLRMRKEIDHMVSDVIKDAAPGNELAKSVGVLLDRAKASFQRVRYNTAVSLLEQARDLKPTDTLVSLLLADAYTFMRGPEDLVEDYGAYERALSLLDEVLEREPDNMLVRLRRAAVFAILAPEEEMLAQQRQLVDDARGGPYESVAELELARRYLSRGQTTQALELYGQLQKRHDWLACVLHSEQGVAYAMAKDSAKACEHFERAVALTTPEAMAKLQEVSTQLIGESYWAAWSNIDNLPARQCQNHAWLAGLYSDSGDSALTNEHLALSLRYLASEEIGPALPVLKKQFVWQMEERFPTLAATPEVLALRQEIEDDQK